MVIYNTKEVAIIKSKYDSVYCVSKLALSSIGYYFVLGCVCSDSIHVEHF